MKKMMSLALGASVAAIAAGTASPAAAQCTPDPTVTNGSTNCTGADADGLRIEGANSTATVQAGATVRPGAAQAAVLAQSTNGTLIVRGEVLGGDRPGILGANGAPRLTPCDRFAGAALRDCPSPFVNFSPQSLTTITVAGGGVISGTAAIQLSRPTVTDTGFVNASITNAGQLLGSAGPAVVAGPNTRIDSLNNQIGGFIGGVSGDVSALTNAGTINGGAQAAVAAATPLTSAFSVTNAGVLTSAGVDATLSNTGVLFAGNTGTIRNTGAGAAIRSGSFASMTNGPTGVIAASSRAGVAMQIGDGLSFTNQGSVVGSILVSAGGSRPTTIDTLAGTITGDVRLDRTDDRLISRFDRTTGRLSSVTGAVDGGAGLDTLQVRIDGDATLGAAAMPLNFERLEALLLNAPAIRLVGGFNATGGLSTIGGGTITNTTALTATSGPVVSMSGSSGTTGQATLINASSIALNATPTPFATTSAVVVSSGSLDNRGTITATGANGANISSFGGAPSTNSGRITATGTGASIFGTLNNSGVIESTGGVGLSVSGSSASSGPSVNTGTISGATVGVRVGGGIIENRGIVSGATGVLFEFGGTFVNAATGVVSGSAAGVRGDGFNTTTLANAGRIDGAVDMAAGNSGGSQDRFVDNGGTVNGAIRLGAGDDLLVTDLGGAAGRPFAGATGGVDGGSGFDTVVYRVRGQATTQAVPVAGFERVGYELLDAASLTLTAPAAQNLGLGFAGAGRVDLTADLSQVNRAVLDFGLARTDRLLTPSPGPIEPNRLDAVSRGALGLTVDGSSFIAPAGAVLAGYSRFENAGGITVTQTGTGTFVAGVLGTQGFSAQTRELDGAVVINSGTISVTGASVAGVAGALELNNSGRITATGGVGAGGVLGVRTVTNSGMIDASGTAVSFNGFGGSTPETLTNTGTITSAGVAVWGRGPSTVIDNQAGGVITGRVAVASQGGVVANAGTINGAVQLNVSPFGGPSFAPGAFVSAGGTVNGGVLFGAGDDVFLQLGEATGVTGVIDGGDGFDLFGRGYTTSATAMLDAAGVNFEGQYIQARGADTVVTIAATAEPIEQELFVGGDGRIVNRAAISASVGTELPYFGFEEDAPPELGLDLVLGEFRNEGALNGGFRGTVRSFVNTGTVGTVENEDGGLGLYGVGDTSLTNSGTIVGVDGALEVDVNDAARVVIANSGTIDGGVYGEVSFAGEAPGTFSISNSGTITTSRESDEAIDLEIYGGESAGSLSLDNTGRISSADGVAVQINIFGDGDADVSRIGFAINNAGRIEAGGSGKVEELFFYDGPDDFTGREVESFTPGRALSIYGGGAGGTIVNSGTIAATGVDSVAILTTRTALVLDNSGVIQGGQGSERTPSRDPGTIFDTLPYLAGAVQSLRQFDDAIRNTGTITGSIDLGAGDDRIENRGLIDGAVFLRGGDDTYLQGAGGSLTGVVDGGEGVDVLAVDATGGGAVAAERFAGFERLTQSGEGSVSWSGAFAAPTLELSGGTVRVEAGRSFSTNGAVAVTGSDAREGVEVAGTLAGAVSLGGGDDLYAEIGSGRATGPVDGGAGVDLYRVTLAGDREGLSAVTGFELLDIGGAGTLSLTLGQEYDLVALSGAGLDVRLNGFAIGPVEGSAGAERFAADGDVAFVSMGAGDDAVRLAGTGFAGSYGGGAGNDVLRFSGDGPATLSGTAAQFETVTVDSGALTVTGAIGGTAVSFGDGAQSFTVADGGRAQGAFDLGGGDDRFQLAAGGLFSGSIAGGAGRDAAAISLAGDRAFGAGALGGFELLSVDGAGTLSLTLAQGLEAVTLAGVGLDLRLGGATIGTVEGSAGAERFAADGDVGRVGLGAGDDFLSLGGATLAGRYDGGAGQDTLRLVGAATLTGQAIGFEALQLEGVTALTVRGVLTAASERLLLGDGAQTIVNAGRIGGSLDFGGGDDVYGEVAGAVLGGAVAGGAGTDLYRVTLSGDRSGLSANTGFERLQVDGAGTLSADVAGDYELVAVSGATLAGAVRFGGGNNRLAIAGGYRGSVSGGAGVDAIEVSGGSEAAPVAFGSIAEVEAFRMTGGFATLSGGGALGSVDLSGGRLVGLAGSAMTASAFNVGQGATFGSAGTVNGNVAVAGTLSPGASPGTMTVNGNVALAGTSVSVFEITPVASDRLVVNGALSIASGATLRIVPTGQLQPGASLDLITASGGITGSFTSVVKPDSLFGFLVQQNGRLSLLGQFRNDASFSGQVGSTIDYANAVLVGGRANAALLAAAPGLVGANGASNAAAFALLAPEAYASARQAAVEQGLTLADAGRGAGFASRRTEPGLFTFGQFAADRRTLRADADRGTARARFGGYGLFGGLGYAGEGWSLGGFVGYLDGRQRLDGRGATTELDGAAFGVHGRAETGAFGLTATVAYAATEADTRRALPGGSARGAYDLTNLTLDVAATYDVAIGGDWSLKPRIGGTVVRVERDRVAETGSAAFAAQVAADEDAVAFVDGALTATKAGAVRPFATLGLRYQAAGRDSLALTGFGGGGLGLVVESAARARVLGTAALGVEADLRPGVTLFSAVAAERGEDDRRESARIGLRVDF